MSANRASRLLPPFLFVLIFALASGFATGLPGQRRSAAPPSLSKGTTEMLVGRFEAAEHWVQKVVTLLSLNEYWHPVGNQMILGALRDRDPRLRAFGLEALLRSDPKLMPVLATPELLDELIGKQRKTSNKHYAGRVQEALQLLAPEANASKASQWTRWWRTAKETHQPAPWQPREQPKVEGGGGTSAASQRAFDLYQSGLDLMICIDSTGSMQPTIDALAEALGEMVEILDGISPKMRLGLVQYKDKGELGKTGARVVQPFSKNIKSARKKLEKLRAYGGGDLPEAVLSGLGLGLSKAMKWQDNANKIAILIGDAPPHGEEKQAAVELARKAHEQPGSQNDNKPTTGTRKEQTPFLTSAIGVFLKIAPGLNVRGRREFEKSQDVMRQDFADIAKAGGGVFVEVEFEMNSATPPTSKEKRAAKKKGGGIASKATRSIVEHILVLSFGDRFAREMKDFVRIFYAYKDGGLIK